MGSRRCTGPSPARRRHIARRDRRTPAATRDARSVEPPALHAPHRRRETRRAERKKPVHVIGHHDVAEGVGHRLTLQAHELLDDNTASVQIGEDGCAVARRRHDVIDATLAGGPSDSKCAVGHDRLRGCRQRSAHRTSGAHYRNWSLAVRRRVSLRRGDDRGRLVGRASARRPCGRSQRWRSQSTPRRAEARPTKRRGNLRRRQVHRP